MVRHSSAAWRAGAADHGGGGHHNDCAGGGEEGIICRRGVHGLTLQRNCTSSQTNVMVWAATRMVAHELQVEEEGGGAAGSYGAKCDPGGKDEGRCVQRE